MDVITTRKHDVHSHFHLQHHVEISKHNKSQLDSNVLLRETTLMCAFIPMIITSENLRGEK
jgi:hypothetical protein